MHDELFPNPQRRSTLLLKLRDLFRELGGNLPIRAFASEAVDRGVISSEELERCQMVGVQALCRQALKVKTEAGLPFAKPTTEDGRNWSQLELFTYGQAEALIEREAKALMADYQELVLLKRWCLEKFGRAPEIPEVQEIETA
jgi:hypothetical protein